MLHLLAAESGPLLPVGARLLLDFLPVNKQIFAGEVGVVQGAGFEGGAGQIEQAISDGTKRARP